ncbi:TonB-dependent receptor, partial [Pseudomonas syringae]
EPWRGRRDGVERSVQEVAPWECRHVASGWDTSLVVRGVGTVATSPGHEPSVASVSDGVVYARPGRAPLDVLGLERLDVLRGRQGAGFGENGSAGVLSVTGV